MKMPFFIVLNIAILVPMSHPLPWNDPFLNPLRPGADQSSKAAFCKSAFAQNRFAFRLSIFASQKAMVWPSAKSKMLSPKTCQNMLESIFAFC